MRKVVLSLLLLNIVLFASSAEELFDSKCSMCHIKTMPKDMSTMIAPAIFGVMNHVKMTYQTKEEALAFINDYVMNPTKKKSICMPMKLEKFGLMPSQKGNLTSEELNKISSWIYDNFPPKNFKGARMGMR